VTTIGRRQVAAIAASLAIVGAYVAVWLRVDARHISLADFTASFVGARMLTQGQGAHLYDLSLQAAVHAEVITPFHGANLPFVYPPTAALLVAPLLPLGLDSAYRVFGLLQAACVVAALALATLHCRGAPTRTPAALLGLAGVATLPLLLLGQTDGVLALGLVGGWLLLGRRREFAAGVVIGATAALIKPHLFVGLAVFLLFRRRGRLLAGGAVGVAAMAAVDLALLGPGGMVALAGADLHDATIWSQASFLGWNGLLASWLGGGGAAQVAAGVLDLAALAACAMLGDAVRRRPECLDVAMAAAMALSLLASPHLLAHDLVLLSPAFVWCLAAVTRETSGGWPGRPGLLLIGGWLLGNATVALDLGNQSPAPPGRLVPLALAAAGAAGLVAVARMGPGLQSAAATPR
jgi:alpha-1,2-mannosyltransferase